jgi:hypothetical protein
MSMCAWLAESEADRLPFGYFQVVFALPAEIVDIAFQHKAVIYDLLFKPASETTVTIAADLRQTVWNCLRCHLPHE